MPPEAAAWYDSDIGNLPKLEEIDGGPGREIKGLEPVRARFSRLEEGRDYEVVSENPEASSERRLQDFFIFINPGGGSEERMVYPPHWRAITTPGVRTEMGGEVYYVANTKGAGYLKPAAKKIDLDRYGSWLIKDESQQQLHGYKNLGIASESDFLHGGIVNKTADLATRGLRCEVYRGVAKLKQLVYRGVLTPIEELRRKKVITTRRDFNPCLGVRLLKTNDRVEEALEAEERRTQIFAEAFKTFNREAVDKRLDFPELTIGKKAHEKIFFAEFFRRMGKNIAVLLNIGHADFYLHSSNVTMAAEVADAGTINHWKEEKEKKFNKVYGGVRMAHIKDMRDIAYVLRKLMKAGKVDGLEVGDRESLKTAFFEGFNGTFDEDQIRSEETDPDKARQWMEKIFDTVIIERENLPSLQTRKIEDWHIGV